jgi:hypothetical protein
MSMGPLSQRTDEPVVETHAEATPRADRSTRRWTTIAAVVGIVACLGIGAALIAGRGSGSKSSGASGVGTPAHGALGALGPVSETRVRALLGDRAAQEQVKKAQEELRRAGTSETTQVAGVIPSAGQANAAVQRCASTLGVQQTVVFTGYGTYRTRRVAVFAVRNHGRTLAFVTSLGNCQQILLSISH